MVTVKFEEEDNDKKLFVVIVQKVDNDIKSKNLKILCVHMEHTTFAPHFDVHNNILNNNKNSSNRMNVNKCN
jgi:hypothetical protein